MYRNENSNTNPTNVPFAILGLLYPRAIRIKKNPMIKSQIIPIQAAFHDRVIATVSVANGPIMNPKTQSLSTVVNPLTPTSLLRFVWQGKILHREFRSRV